MRILSWNCLKGAKKKEKLDLIESLKPDILIMPEAKLSDYSETKQRSWQTYKPDESKALGLGVYIFNEQLEVSFELVNHDLEIFQPLKVKFKDTSVNIMAVWASNKRSMGKYKGKNGVIHKVLEHYSGFLNSKSIWIGDFNNGPEIKSGKAWPPVMDVFSATDMKKLSYDGPRHTHKHNSGTFEIDHCIVGNDLLDNTILTTVKDFNFQLSDHRPLILDLN